MGGRSPARDKSYAFTLDLVRTLRVVQQEQREYVLTKQLMRSGTSIGANVEEANAAQSKKDFVAKMAVASKEARETDYWLRLLRDAGLLEQKVAERLLTDCAELIRRS